MDLNNRFLYNIYRHLVGRNQKLRRLLTNLVVADETVDIDLFGARLAVNKRKETGYFRAARAAAGNVVLRDEVGVMLTLACILQPGDTFVDVGANVGLFSSTLYRIHSIYPDLKFYAFEPHPDTAGRLRRSLSGTAVQVFETALSDRQETMTFLEGASSLVFAEESHAGMFQIADCRSQVPAMRLDEFDIGGDSLVIKIDVEGHELAVLQGASAFLQAGRVKAVFLDGFSDRSIPAYLMQLGFRLFNALDLVAADRETPRQLLALHERHLAGVRAPDSP